MWTKRIAAGDENYMVETKRKLSVMANGRRIIPSSGAYELREPASAYNLDFDTENDALRLKNTFFWDINYDISDT
jgi:hypothetical protein